jgi:hypothetical protein
MCTNTHYGQPENHSDTQTNGWYKIDGFVKSPISALRFILRHCGVPSVRLIPQDSQALISDFLRSRPKCDFLRVHQKDSAEAVAYLVVSVPDAKPRTVRVNITVPEMTLKQIDAAAKKRGMSRSSFLVHLAQNEIHSHHSQPSA